MIAATFTGLYLLVRRRSNPVVAILVTMVAGGGVVDSLAGAPAPVHAAVPGVFYALLERVREGNTRIAGVPVLAVLPAISILWTNLHGGFFVGAMLVGAYGAGELAAHSAVARRSRSRPRRGRSPTGIYSLSGPAWRPA